MTTIIKNGAVVIAGPSLKTDVALTGGIVTGIIC